MRSLTLLSLLALSSATGAYAQTKKANKPADKSGMARSWHRQMFHDEVEGDRVMYYLPSVEDDRVLLVVGCHNRGTDHASLYFPFKLYGATETTLRYKPAIGDTKQDDFKLTDGHDAVITLRATDLSPLVGVAFKVEDESGNFHTYHLPAAGTKPFDTSCRDEVP